MHARSALPLVAVALAALAGCASTSLSLDDRQRTCRFDVERKVGSPAFKPNPVSNVAGGAIGAGAGVLMLNPFFAVLGAIGGSACAAGSFAHPTADADFARLIGEADFGNFERALGERLNAPRDACRSADAGVASRRSPDAVVTIDSATATMGCLYGDHQYWLDVKWRATDARTGRELASSATRCVLRSSRSVDDWFADPAYAKSEIERLMAGTGTAIAESVLGDASYDRYSICELR
jgi:hypothetical protein